MAPMWPICPYMGLYVPYIGAYKGRIWPCIRAYMAGNTPNYTELHQPHTEGNYTMATERLTVSIPSTVLHRARATVQALSGHVAHTDTVSDLVTYLLAREVTRLEHKHNHGEYFPPVEGRLPSGPKAHH